MSDKTYTVAGYSNFKGARRFRTSNDLAGRYRTLVRCGDTDIRLFELPMAMTAEAAAEWVAEHYPDAVAGDGSMPLKSSKPKAAKPKAAKPKAAKAAKPNTDNTDAEQAAEFKARRLAVIRAAAERVQGSRDAVDHEDDDYTKDDLQAMLSMSGYATEEDAIPF
jgi:hypothetical protein